MIKATRHLFFYLLASLVVVSICNFSARAVVQDPSVEQLQQKLNMQYAAIEAEIVAVPARAQHPDAWRIVLRAWQDRLASRFSDAALTVEEIIKVDPANADMWRERLETLRLYAQPISSPGERTVYSAGEVQKPVKLIDKPDAIYTPEARAEKVRDQVRLRVVLAADGTVRNVFPIKSSRLGLTESAMSAVRQIRFEPAIRNGQPASQFVTFVYEFKKKNAEPFIPPTIF